MFRKLILSSGFAALAIAAAIAGPAGQTADADDARATTPTTKLEAHAITAADLEAHATTVKDIEQASQQGDTTAQVLGWDVPWAMSYYLEASCSPYAGAVRQGAAAWNQLSEGGGTPVECRTDYITDCGGAFVVGCNWGAGQRIALFPGGVNDDALLAAPEFGHDWYGHSSYQCAGWGSPAEVMAPSICNLSVAADGALPRGRM